METAQTALSSYFIDGGVNQKMAHIEEIMVNGVLTRVNQLDSTAQEVDDAVSASGWQTNPNLLHNWFFANPVNQRGQTAYSGTGYGIDRWKSSNVDSSYAIDSTGISFTSRNLRFDQLLERPELLVGKRLTLSALITENTGTAAFYAARIVSGNHATVVYKDAGFTGLMSGTFNASEGFEGVRFFTTSGFTGKVTVAAVKLELGTQQTLAHQDTQGNWVLNEIPDYGDQLLKCQRYYQLFSSSDRRPSDKRDFRPELRTNATSSNTGTITIDGATYYYADAEL